MLILCPYVHLYIWAQKGKVMYYWENTIIKDLFIINESLIWNEQEQQGLRFWGELFLTKLFSSTKSFKCYLVLCKKHSGSLSICEEKIWYKKIVIKGYNDLLTKKVNINKDLSYIIAFLKYNEDALLDLISSLNKLQLFKPFILLTKDQLDLEQLNTFCINECTSNSSDSYFDFYKLIEKFDCELIQYNNYSGESSLSIYKSIGS